jgi:hypothetical protein
MVQVKSPDGVVSGGVELYNGAQELDKRDDIAIIELTMCRLISFAAAAR